jgi:hypothetical protein
METHAAHPGHGGAQGRFWRSRAGIVFIVFAVVAAAYLLLEHRAHVIPWLPFGLLLLCPLMHLFMHGGHGGHSAPRGNNRGAPAP